MEGDNTEYVQTHSVDEWRDSYIHQTARQELAKNEWPASCVKCKVDEEQGLVSQRLKPSIYGPGITHLDLRFSNSCNLSCSMCSPGSSNTIYHEHKKIIAINKESPWTTLEPANIDWYDEDRINKLLESLPDVKQIYLTGGEPFMVKGILHFLQRLDSDTQLRFNTNATIINPKVFNELMIIVIYQSKYLDSLSVELLQLLSTRNLKIQFIILIVSIKFDEYKP
jgi:organic radical activating enzyme